MICCKWRGGLRSTELCYKRYSIDNLTVLLFNGQGPDDIALCIVPYSAKSTRTMRTPQ